MITETALQALAEAGGYRNDAGVQKAIHNLFINTDERDLETIKRLARRFDMEAKLGGRTAHPFLPSPPSEAIRTGELVIGRIPYYGETVTVPAWSHTYVAGTTGLGKTTLVELLVLQAYRLGMRVIVFDPEGQFAPDIGGEIPGDELYVVDAESYEVNPFVPPPGMDLRDWLGEMANVQREASNYRRGSENFFINTALRLADAGHELELRSFVNAVMANMPRGRAWREYQSFETVKTSMESLTLRMPPLTTAASPGLEEMLSRPVVIFDWLSHKNMQDRKFLTMHTLSWLLSARDHDGVGVNRPIDTVVVCDEVSKLASIELQNQNDLGEPFFIQAIRTARKRGISFVTLDQDPARTHPVVRANSQTQVVLQLREGRDKDVIAHDLDLSREQRAYLAALPPREAIVRLPHVPTPFLVEIPEILHADSPEGPEPGTNQLPQAGAAA